MDDEEDDEDEGVFGNANSDAGEDEEEPDVNEFRPQLETLQESQDPRSSRPQPPPSEQDVTPEPTAPPEGHDITAALRLKREDDREKGKAISRQLVRVSTSNHSRSRTLTCFIHDRPCTMRSSTRGYGCKRVLPARTSFLQLRASFSILFSDCVDCTAGLESLGNHGNHTC
jgi:hypothetical protein